MKFEINGTTFTVRDKLSMCLIDKIYRSANDKDPLTARDEFLKMMVIDPKLTDEYFGEDPPVDARDLLVLYAVLQEEFAITEEGLDDLKKKVRKL